MSSSIEYNGYLIEPTTKLKDPSQGWTLEVRLTPADRRTKVRRCRGSNMYPTKQAAVGHCLEFGRQIVDGKLQRKAKPPE